MMSCPYAASLVKEESVEEKENRSTQHGNTGTSVAKNATSAAEALTLAKASCPAFQTSTGGCPFKNVKGGDEFRNVMRSVPPSHYDTETSAPFRVALEHVHSVSSVLHHAPPKDDDSDRSNSFVLPGGCPFKLYNQTSTEDDDSKENVLFVDAIEHFSLSAAMARLARDMDRDEHGRPRSDSIISSAGAENTTSTTLTASVVDEDEDTTTKEPPSGSMQEQQSLSTALKSGTAISHAAAENVHFVRDFVRGKIDIRLYGQLVTDLYFVYDTMESLLNQCAPTHFPSLHYPIQLSRTEALMEDMDYFHGDDWNMRQNNKPSPATRDYMDRLEWIAKTEPLLLVSHAYTRYLGDLSGGTVLARVARRAMNLGSEGGLSFYSFDQIESAKQFKDMYRQQLDGLNVSQPIVARLVAEANVAFLLNMRLFEELDVESGIPGSTVRPLAEALQYFDRVAQQQKETKNNSSSPITATPHNISAASAECPFGFKSGSGVNPHDVASSKKSPKKPMVAVTEKPVVTTATATTEMKKKDEGRCPWPFVFFHDPVQGMQDFQTWVVIGLILCWIWNMYTSK